jgi:sodium-dependent phosphate cotransporter
MPDGAPPSSRRTTWLRVLLVIALLYLFLSGVKSLEAGIKALGSGFTDALFEGVSNPIAGLFVGILATVLVQSSSVSTATIVGLVGAGTLTVPLAVPMIMGANIGTTVTNTLASLGYLRRSAEFKRAFAGATMHDFFNLLAVAVLLPLELATKFLSRTATELTEFLRGAGTLGIEQPDSPIKAAVRVLSDLVERILDAAGAGDTVSGVVLLVVGLAAIFTALALITRTMRSLLIDRIERSINAILERGAGVPAMALGVVITVAVQSSSITTSVLVPLIAAGLLTLRNAYPVTLGANLGTTVTALLASLATERPEGLAIALTHTLFNLSGILIFYPIPWLRHLPVRMAERLAGLAEVRKSLVLVYVFGGFVVIPLLGVLALR